MAPREWLWGCETWMVVVVSLIVVAMAMIQLKLIIAFTNMIVLCLIHLILVLSLYTAITLQY